jgi:hypothetical protein
MARRKARHEHPDRRGGARPVSETDKSRLQVLLVIGLLFTGFSLGGVLTWAIVALAVYVILRGGW